MTDMKKGTHLCVFVVSFQHQPNDYDRFSRAVQKYHFGNVEGFVVLFACPQVDQTTPNSLGR